MPYILSAEEPAYDTVYTIRYYILHANDTCIGYTSDNELTNYILCIYVPDSKVYGANMGPTRVLLAPDGPHVGSFEYILIS